MSTDERPESLASQAASWVPPWERRRTPDPAYAAAAGPIDVADPDAVDPDDADPDDADPDDANQDPVDPGGADLDDDPDIDDPEGDERPDVPPELPPIPGEVDGPVTVDAPQILPDEVELAPTDVGVAPDVPVPDALEAAEDADSDDAERGSPVDAPAPPDGDDAGDVFDAAADDDLADDPADLPVTEPAEPDRAEPDRAEPSRAEPSRAEPDRAEPDRAGSEPAEPDPLEPAESAQAGSPVATRGSGDAGPPAATARRRTLRKELVADVLPAIDDAELRAALEAILLVVDEPVGELQLAQIMELPAERVATALEEISAAYTAAGNGFDLRRAAGGWRLYTRPEYAPYVERFVLDGQSVRLTQAALETLAVIAYKQPVTRSRISVIRGVNCDGVMRTLVTRGLIEECGVETETGAFLYRTTVLFLEKLGLNSVDQLPPLAPFLPDDVEEVIDAQR